MSGTVLAVNVGMPRDVQWNDRTVFTGIWKRPVEGPVMARRLNLDGDGQGDQAGHGGEQRAVMVYQIESYDYWQREFGRSDFEYGQFGENLTISGLPDDEVCIGDRYRIGAAEFEVTQPRVTCFRVGLRLDRPDMASLLVSHHRPGFYFRVITEGLVRAGDEIVLISRGRHALSVADVDALLYLPGPDPERLRLAADVPALSPGWQQSFAEMLAGGTAAAPPVGVEPGWTGFRRLQVDRVVHETEAVLSIYLSAVDGGRLAPPRAGQFLTLRIPGDPAPVRSYSLSSSPTATAYRISVKREEHGLASRWIHANLAPGSVVDAAAPRGDFRLDPDSPDPIVLVSAGIGVTPVLAMLHSLAEAGSTREIWWLHTARTAQLHAFAAEARELLRRLPNARSRTFYTAGPPDGPDSVAGRLDLAALRGTGIPASAAVYVCGPDAFMDAMQKAFIDLGVDPGRIHTERFGALDPINPGIVGATAVPPHQPAGEPGTGPLVTFARSGLSSRWNERYPSLLEFAEACDVPTRWSCRTGVCHTCITTRLSGQTSYTGSPLVPPGGDEVLICSARPDTDLVLDL